MTSLSRSDHPRQRSSMESFLDEYQLVRLILTSGGTILVLVYALLGNWDHVLLPTGLALAVSATHAGWCRWKRIRTPNTMVLIDLTLWGSLMLLSESIAVPTASLAFLTLLVAIFVEGYRLLLFLAYLWAWYLGSYFLSQGFAAESFEFLGAVVVTVGGVAVVVSRIRSWMGQLDATRSQMLGSVSHELRNNLTGMMGVTELVGSGAQLDPAESAELIKMAHQQAVDASEIVEDLLTVARVERSELTVSMDMIDVNHEVATTVQRFVGEGAAISVRADDDLPMASGDPLRTRQVLRNLVSNAIRYGGPDIVITTRWEGKWVEVIVADDGDGVPPDEENTIFLPYRRSTITPRHASSVGLGLWICRHLASAMGGSLTYRRSDDWTQFVFTLKPVSLEPEPTVGGEPARAGASPSRADDSMLAMPVRLVPSKC